MSSKLLLGAIVALIFTPTGQAHAVSSAVTSDPAASMWLQAVLPGAQLHGVRNVPRHLPYTGEVLHHVKAFDLGAGKSVGGVFDGQGNRLVDDGRAAEAAERRARWLARGGIIDDLWDDLGTLQPAERIPVVIWLRAEEPHVDKALLLADPIAQAQELADRTAGQAAAKQAFREAFASVSTAPLSEDPGVPAVRASLTGAEIEAIAWLPIVGFVARQAQQSPQSGDTWVDSCLASYADTGLTGYQEQVCILEPRLPLAQAWQNDPCCDEFRLTTVNNYNCAYEAPDHGRGVAWAIANYGTPSGTASGAYLDYACWQTASNPSNTDASGARNWCANTQGDHVWNWSYDCQAADSAALDYWVRHWPYPLITTSVGNIVNAQTGAACAIYNGLVVGGANESGTAVRSDDGIYASSRYANPSKTAYGNNYADWELPNLVAPAQSLTFWTTGISGTSYAAPMVAGAAAQMHEQNPALRIWPEAVRSILMCTAAMDIDNGRLNLMDSVDDKDGAGLLHVNLATAIADSSWRKSGGNTADTAGFDYGTITSSATPNGNYFSSVYHAVTPFTDTRMRVVLTFDASSSCTNPGGVGGTESCGGSQLEADLDLEVWTTVNGSPQLVDYSTTATSSYEFIEFAAEANRQYDIKIKAYHWYGTATYYGISWLIVAFGQSSNS